MKKKWRKYFVPCLAVASFVIAMLEGLIYYESYQNTPVFWLILVQNSVKAFLFSPMLDAMDVLDSLKACADIWKIVVGYAYVVAIIAAPFCTATAAWRAIELFLRQKLFFPWWKKSVTMVYGWNPTVEKILKHETGKKETVYLVTEQELTDACKQDLARRKIYLCNEEREKKLRSKARRFFLLDESSNKNFSRYISLQVWWSKSRNKQMPPQVVCTCEESGMCELFTTYHDAHTPALPISLIDMAQLQAQAVWEAHPICQYNFGSDSAVSSDKAYDVHMVVVGFGKVGQRLLLQAMSLSVLSTESRIVFDVIDRRGSQVMETFYRNFSQDYVSIDREAATLSILNDHADGRLTVRFHTMELDDGRFPALVSKLNAEMGLTYAAVCVEDTDSAIRCLFHLDGVLRYADRKIPLAVRMEHSTEISGYLKEKTTFFADVFPICGMEALPDLDKLENKVAYDRAIQFNHAYDVWSARLSGKEAEVCSAEESWAKLARFKQQSSLHQYLHQEVKRRRLRFDRERGYVPTVDATSEEYALLGTPPLTDLQAMEFARLEHRRWCYYMASTGWSFGEEKDPALKRHPCMVPWQKLCQTRPDTCCYDTTPYRILTNEKN